MLGFSDKHSRPVDPTTLPIFVHALQSAEAFGLAQKVWDNNNRNVLLDTNNHKELLRFVFNEPACVVWLERDEGRQNVFELVLLWEANDAKKAAVSEVYVIMSAAEVANQAGDDTRAKSLLSAILSSPAIVPVNQNKPAAPAPQ